MIRELARAGRAPRRRRRRSASSCDHVEVLYDLDVRGTVDRRRARRDARIAPRAVNAHPQFIAMLADLVHDRARVRARSCPARDVALAAALMASRPTRLVIVGGGIAGLCRRAPRGRAARRARPGAAAHADRGRASGWAAASPASASTASSSRRARTRSSPRSRGRWRCAGGSASKTALVRTDDRFRKVFVLVSRPPASAARRLPAPGADRAAAVRHLVALLAGRASCAWRSTCVLPRGSGDDESLGRVRAPPAGHRGAGARGLSRWWPASTRPTPTI